MTRMKPTVLVYSAHSRCNLIHNDWIVQRALAGNRRLLFLPFSERPSGGDEIARQAGAWDRFRWFFDFYRGYGLEAAPFYWSSRLERADVEVLLEMMADSEVVLLGGGNPWLGRARLRGLGRDFFDDGDRLPRVLRERRERGLLTAGFSAGADQLGEHMSNEIENGADDDRGFGLARQVISVNHYEAGRAGALQAIAHQFGNALAFGLPNDSGLAIEDGWLHSGRRWQLIEMIIDTTWDRPEDQFHIKTRQGEKIHHFYADGRHWAFGGGDRLMRLEGQDGRQETLILPAGGGPAIDYWAQVPTGLASIEAILARG